MTALPVGAGVFKAGGPPLIGRDTGRELARRELAKPIYHRGVSLAEQIYQKITNFLDTIFRHANASVPGGWWALVVLGTLAVIVLGVVLSRIGPIALGHRAGDRPLLGADVTTARGHRELARRLAATADWTGAIREILRAMALDLEERAILPPRPGRTADEFAMEAGRALPGYADDLMSAARLFDDVWYGGQPGTEDGYEELRRLDEAVGAARPVPLEPASAAGSIA
ncbi:MAG: DUF4129 domain-containing protein [Micromonosporaceae bacterium]